MKELKGYKIGWTLWM